MPQGYLEHANLSVSDPERSAALLQNALLQKLCGWQERWRGLSQMGGWTIHVGDANAYVALYTRGDGKPVPRHAKGQPLNHVGLVVDNLDAAEAVVVEAGLEPFNHDDYAPGRRFYFFDWDGIEFELATYS